MGSGLKGFIFYILARHLPKLKYNSRCNVSSEVWSFRTIYGGVILACMGSWCEHLRCPPWLLVGDVVPCDLRGGGLPGEGHGGGAEVCKMEVGGSLDHWLSYEKKANFSDKHKIQVTVLNFIAIRGLLVYWPENLWTINSPVLRMRVNGSLLVFPLIVYRLTE